MRFKHNYDGEQEDSTMAILDAIIMGCVIGLLFMGLVVLSGMLKG